MDKFPGVEAWSKAFPAAAVSAAAARELASRLANCQAGLEDRAKQVFGEYVAFFRDRAQQCGVWQERLQNGWPLDLAEVKAGLAEFEKLVPPSRVTVAGQHSKPAQRRQGAIAKLAADEGKKAMRKPGISR